MNRYRKLTLLYDNLVSVDLDTCNKGLVALNMALSRQRTLQTNE